MSNRQSSWMTSSVSRPTASSSPSLGRINDIKGRLSFSAMKTPAFKPKQMSLVDQAARASASPVNSYHMSKQNPDVLDRLCSPSPSHRDHLLHKRTQSPAVVRVGGGSGVLVGGRNGHSPSQSSLVKQMLLNDKHRAPASLVHLATRGKAFRTGVNVSPVVVKLSGSPAQTLPSSLTSDSNQERSGVLENGSTEAEHKSVDRGGQSVKISDPCDKNVVLSALRQRRKRWATSAPDDGHGSSSSTSPHVDAPSAKRSKHSSHGSESLKSPLSYIFGDRKRAYTAPSYSMSPDAKKSRFGGSDGQVCGPPPSSNSKTSIPEEECDRESVTSEHSELGEQGSGRSSKASSRAPSECIGGLDHDGLQRRSLTPPVQFDEAEMNRKREESLNSLKAVFSPKGGEKKSSHRRKLPVFCATGTKPHLPTPLSTTHSVTQEDLKKDREAAAAKLREILTAEDKPLPPKSESTTNTIASSKAPPTNSLSGVRLSSSLSGSLPSLPLAAKTPLPSTAAAISGPPLTVSSAATANSVKTSLTASSVSLTSLVSTAAAPLSITTASAAPQTQVKSVSFAPLPVPTPAPSTTTQAGFSFQLSSANGSQASSLIQPAATNTSLLAGPSATATATAASTSTLTGLQLPQLASSLAMTAPPTLTTTSNVTQQQVNKPTGLALPASSLNTQQQQQLSTGLSLPSQQSLFQSSTSAVPSLGPTAPAQGGGGGVFGGGTLAGAAPSVSTSSIKFAIPSTTQQQPPQSSNTIFQSTASSSTATSGGMFGLNSALQMANSSSQPPSSSLTGSGGIVFGVPQPQQQQQASQPSIFQGGVSFSSSRPQDLSAFSTTSSNSALNLNFGTGGNAQKNPPGGSLLSFGVGNQSSGSGLSLFKNSGNAQQPPKSNPPSSSIFGNGATTSQPPQQSQQTGAAGFTGFKLSAGAIGPQTQGTQLSIFGKSNSTASGGGGSSGASFTAGQTGAGGSTSSSGFPSFNVGGNSSGFNFTAGTSSSGVGIFQKPPASTSAQTNTSLGMNGVFSAGNGGGGSSGVNFSIGTASNNAGGGLFQKAGSGPGQNTSSGSKPQNSSGINFSFSANALKSQPPSQGGANLFAFGQKPGTNFAATSRGNTSGIGIGNQSQNGNGGINFNFGGTGMGTSSTGNLFNASNIFQSSLQQQQQPTQNVFQTPQTQKQLSFTTPAPQNQQNTHTQGGSNFQQTPSFFTPGTSNSSRPVARARRRKKN